MYTPDHWVYDPKVGKFVDPETLKSQSDPVDHPSHYTQYDGFEVIDITEQLDFVLGNVVKYTLRAGSKENELEDLKKARWYLDRKIKKLEEHND